MLRIWICLLQLVFTMMGKRKDLIQISHGKYHYTEIIFTNSFEASQKAIQKDIKKNYIKKS